MSSSRRPRVMYLVTHPASARLLLVGQLGFMREQGFDVTVVAGPGPDLDLVAARERVRVVSIPMAREISPHRDLVSLGRVTRAIRSLRPDIVNASTPKAGLLGIVAAQAMRVPIRIYLLRGLRLETEFGVREHVLGATERLASRCATDVVAVSPSLRERYVVRGLAPEAKVRVLGPGSSNGFDTSRFRMTPELARAGESVRSAAGIPPRAPVVGFIGRLTPDKGIVDLLEAFAAIRRLRPTARLLVVSADLDDEATPVSLRARLRQTEGVVLIPRVDDVRPHLGAMDVLAFPSRREGFPNVVLEAAALERPTVGYRATGVSDAIVDGVTGALVTVGDRAALVVALDRYLGDAELRTSHGRAARDRAVTRFSRREVWQRWAALYVSRLKARGLPCPAH